MYGAPFGTLVCYAFIAITNLVILRQQIRLPGLGKLFFRPMAACIGMGAGAYLTYRVTSGILGNSIGVILSICVAGVLYLVLLLALQALEKDDILMMPKGEKLVRLLRLR